MALHLPNFGKVVDLILDFIDLNKDLASHHPNVPDIVKDSNDIAVDIIGLTSHNDHHHQIMPV